MAWSSSVCLNAKVSRYPGECCSVFIIDWKLEVRFAAEDLWPEFRVNSLRLPEAVGMVRAIRRAPANDNMISVSAADPLNLIGVITPGARITAHTSNRILYRDGIAGGNARIWRDEVSRRTEPGDGMESQECFAAQDNAARATILSEPAGVDPNRRYNHLESCTSDRYLAECRFESLRHVQTGVICHIECNAWTFRN